MRRIVKVSDLKCDGCVTRLEQYLRGSGGINSVVGDLDDREIMVDFNEKTITLAGIRKIITAAGYTPGKVIED